MANKNDGKLKEEIASLMICALKNEWNTLNWPLPSMLQITVCAFHHLAKFLYNFIWYIIKMENMKCTQLYYISLAISSNIFLRYPLPLFLVHFLTITIEFFSMDICLFVFVIWKKICSLFFFCLQKYDSTKRIIDVLEESWQWQ